MAGPLFPFWVAAMVASVGAGAFVVSRAKDDLHTLARATNLKATSAGTLIGTRDGCRVVLSPGFAGTDVRVWHPDHLDVTIGLDSAWRAEDVQLGHTVHDQALYLEGREEELLACLDLRTRNSLRIWVSEGSTVDKGVVRCVVKGRAPSDVNAQLARMVPLARAMALPTGVVGGLRARVTDSSEHAKVRANALRALIAHSAPAGAELCGLLLNNPRTPDALLAEVLRVDMSLCPQALEAALPKLVRHPTLRVRVFALAAQLGLRLHENHLRAMLFSTDDDTVELVARYVTTMEYTTVTDTLIRALSRTTRLTTRRALIGALRVSADRRAVRALEPFVSLFSHPSLKAPARDAIAHLNATLAANSVFNRPA